MKWIFLTFFLVAFFLSGCGIREREKTLREKEAELARREQQLLIRAEALRLKEEELLRKTQKLDSTQQDTAFSHNPKIVGLWSVKMVCTETTCPGSAIGDTKTEIWDISYQNKQVVATALDNQKVVRTYTGTYKNNLLELSERVETPANAPATHMLVRLKLVGESAMEGEREIIRTGDCRIVYALEMNK